MDYFGGIYQFISMQGGLLQFFGSESDGTSIVQGRLFRRYMDGGTPQVAVLQRQHLPSLQGLLNSWIIRPNLLARVNFRVSTRTTNTSWMTQGTELSLFSIIKKLSRDTNCVRSTVTFFTGGLRFIVATAAAIIDRPCPWNRHDLSY